MTIRAWADALGAGAAQLVFSSRPATGAVLLVAIAVAAPLAGLTALVGVAAATAFAAWSRWNRLLLRDGLFGYNGVLVGLVWPALFGIRSPGFWLLIPAAVAATALQGALLPAFTRRGVPVLGLPFLAVVWAVSVAGSLLGWRLPQTIPPPTIGGPLAGWHHPVILRAIAGLAAPAVVVLALLALAAVLDSRTRLAALAAGGAGGLAVALVLGGAEGLLWVGAVVYNAVPAAIALADGVPLARGQRRLALAVTGGALAALVWAVLTPPLLAIGLFPLTAPMHVVVLAFVLLLPRTVAVTARGARPPAEAVDALSGLIRRSSRIVVLSGAGMSTESGIPDYRSQIGFWFDANGDDLVYQRFLASEDSRRLYWRLQARFARVLDRARPNAGHLAVAQLERDGTLLGVITQNVDGLHQLAGCAADHVVELHGSARWVVCLACAHRAPYRAGMTGMCAACGGMAKTETVSFGERLAPDRVTRAVAWSQEADLMLLLGSSFEVDPARSLPKLARARGVPLVVVNHTATPWDASAALVVRADVGATLAAAVSARGGRRIRAMTRADFAFICGVVDAWWGDAVRYLLHPLYVEHFGETALVMEDDAGLAGFLIGFYSQTHPDEAYVHLVAVAPDRRGAGIGRALYERIIALARRRGCRRVVAITVPYNAGAIAFHRALGFKPREDGAVWQGDVPVVLDYAGPGVHCIVMQLDL